MKSQGIIEACTCIRELGESCGFQLLPNLSPRNSTSLLDDPDFGRMAYTLAILLMFSFVIVLLMVRSIKRSSGAIEMDALLDAMRFREELDLQERQRRRLQKAKSKVSAWLARTHGGGRGGKGWRSSPQLLSQAPRRQTNSTVSEIPEIIVTRDYEDGLRRTATPCLSLIYDFAEEGDSTCSIRKQRGSTESERLRNIREARQSVGSDSIGAASFISRCSTSLDIDVSHPPRLSIHSLSLE